MLTDRSRIARPSARKVLCSSLAIATALIVGSGMARAQSFQGNGTFASGTGTIGTATGTTTVNITSSDAVIDWTTFDTAIGGGSINFQPASTTATFQSVSDFSVLNRIIPTDPSRAIQFNGNIIAQIQGTSTVPGGSVYFYSPGGVIVGSTAVFNVGNLGLTSIAPEVVGGIFEQGTGSEFVRFNGAVTPGSAVTIQAGAQINVPNNNYVAIVAPMVNNAGTINVNGAAALVSADAATITFNPTGLFDIQVTSGTSSTGNSGNGRTLINTGTITGPAFNGTGAMHRIYAVAVPKNTAITMVIGNGSSLGFNIAGAANIAGNAVILSAGHDVVGGQIVATPSAGGGSGSVMIDSFNANYTSEVVARATGRALFASDGTVGAGNTSFAANLTAHSATIASLEARSGGSANVTGNLTLDANAFAATPTSSVTAGNAYLDARNGASLTVGGNAVVVATAQGGNATGGNADATADTGGVINVAGVLRVRAEGLGGSGGSGTGGMASINARAGGDIFANQLNLTAEGVGGDDVGAGAGNGRGGNILLIANGTGSTINIANGNSTGTGRDLFFMAARGFGGQSNGGGSGVGGSAFGGNVSISATNGATLNGPANVGTRGFVQIFARAFAGDANTGASAGGAATGGNINITVDNAIFTSAELLPSSFAQAGSALPTATGTINGGNATGGTRNITVRNGATATTAFGGGGPGAQGGDGTLNGRGGDASGGSASLVVNNATLTLTGRATVFSQNVAGSGGTAGNVSAGTAFGQVSNGAVVNVFNDTASVNDDFSITANAFGAVSPATPGIAQGTVTAGTATLLVQGGTIQGSGTVGVAAGAFAQSDQYAQGGTYRGGTANLQVQGGTVSVAQIRVSANAEAAAVGAGLSGTGGSATGGTARLQLNGGTLSGSGLEVNAEAFGGAIGTSGSGNGGMATGGLASIPVGAGSNTLTFNTINVTADAEGGDVSGTVGNGGAGVGGVAQINVFGGASLTVNASTTVIESDGLGGDALSLTGNGGGGNAGRAILVVDGGSATFNGNVSLSGDSGGGNGINGGTAFGDPENGQSRAFLFARNGSLAITGLTALHAVASGGTGNLAGNGGNASGGFANVAANNLVSGGGFGILTLGDLDIDSGAQGGSATGTGNGGNGAAGRAHLFANGGTITVGGTATLSGDAIGGDGVNGGNAISARPDLQPRALIGAFNGTIDVAGATSLVASASGGSGRLGGTGGVAFAGQAAVDAQSPNGSSAISLGTLNIEASALGGFGGAGASGQTGGLGGDAYGGPISAFGNAGRGVLTVRGNTLLRTGATGGTGGQGGTGGTSAPGAVGGAGGRAFGGSLTVGTRSGVDTPSNTGSATFGLVSGDANALGGAGGAGGLGTTQGAGGAGGSGFGGSAGILVRGSPATFGDVTLTANGTGGNGGAGSVQGDGGDGYAGDGFVNVTQRFMRTERGSLTANNVNITSAGIGGVGATAGDTFYSAATGAESDFFIRQSNVTLANLVLTTSGALAPNFSTTVLRVVDPVASGIPVSSSVTVIAEPFDLAMADSTASISGAFTLSTPGNMRVSLGNSTLNVGNLTLSAGNFVLPAVRPATLGTINVSSGLTISTLLDFLAYANFNVAGSGFFDVGGSVLTGDLTFGGDLVINADGSIATGAITTGESIKLDAFGAITTGQLTAGARIDAASDGPMSVAGASAGIVNRSSNPETSFDIGLSSTQSSLTVGDLAAFGSVVVTAPGTVAVGNVSSGSAGLGFLALAGTGLTTGSIDTAASPGGGQIYLANHSMMALAGGPNGTDPTPILAATPVAIGGPIAINGSVSTGKFQAATSQSFTAGAMTATAGSIEIDAGGAFNTGALTASQNIDLVGGGTLNSGALTAGDTVVVSAVGALNVASATAGIVNPSTNPLAEYNIGLRSLTSISAGNLAARASIGVASPGAITVGSVTTGSGGLGFIGLAGTGLTTGAIDTSASSGGGQVYLANFSMEALGGQVSSNFNPLPILAATPVAISGPIAINGATTTAKFQAAATGAISTQAITASTGPIVLRGGAQVSSGNLSAFSIDIVAPQSITLGSLTSTATAAQLAALGLTNGVSLTASGGALATGAIISAGSIDLIAGQDLTTGAVNVSAGSVEMDAGGAAQTGSIASAQSLRIFAGTTASTGNLVAGNNANSQFSIGIATNGAVSTGTINASRDIGLLSQNAGVAAGNVVTGTSLGVLTRGPVNLGSVTTGTTASNFLYIANASMAPLGGTLGPNFNPGPIFAATPVATTGAIAISGPIVTGNIRAATTATIATGAISGLGGTLTGDAGVSTGAIAASQSISLVSSAGAVSSGSIQAGDSVFLAGNTGITVNGAVSAGLVSPSTNPGAQYKVAISGGNGSVTTGAVSAQRDLGIAAKGSITTGDLRGRDVLLLGGTGVSTGAILAGSITQPNGRVYVGNFSQATQSANVFSPFINQTGGLAIFNAVPTPVGGNVTFGGGVQAGSVTAAATGGFTAQAITALNFLRVDAGGLVTVNGRWQSGNLEIVSSDIDIATTGSLDSGALGELSLASRNSSGAFIGDGLSGSGFNLSNAEFAKLTAGDIKIIAFDMTGLATDMTIGNLTITGSQLYSGSVGADGANGIVLFATGNPLTETAGGILRVAGNVSATGFTPTTEIDLISGTVEIEAANGSVKVSAGSDTSSTGSPSLGGLIFVEADNIHIASDAILTKLRADPLYTGHIDELNAPAAVQRPDGVFNALGFEINVGETFYIQNTGSRIVPAGFLTTFDASDVFASDTPPTGGVEIVINGQFQTSTGTVTGKAAYDLIAADPTADSEQFLGFSSTSQLNGCVFLSGICALGGNTQMAPPASEISVIISPVLAASPPPPAVEEAGPGDSSASSSESEAAAEEADSSDDEKKDEGDGDEAASPIAPPAPLISTRALDGDVNVVEPVSGAGNPALFGSAVNETTIGGGKP